MADGQFSPEIYDQLLYAWLSQPEQTELYGDPNENGKGWFKSPSEAFKIRQRAAYSLGKIGAPDWLAEELGVPVGTRSQNVFGTEQQYSLPFFLETYSNYYGYAKTLPEPKPDWITPELEKQLETLPLEQFKYQMWQAQEKAGVEAKEFEWQKRMDIANLQRQEEQDAWGRQVQQAQMLAEYSGAQDWIKRWFAEQGMESPYTNPIQTRAAIGRQRIEETQQNWREELNDMLSGKYSGNPELMKIAQESLKGAQEIAKTTVKTYLPAIQAQQQTLQNLKSGKTTSVGGTWGLSGGTMQTLLAGGMGGGTEGKPATPPAPPWLSNFVPSQTTGQPITKSFVRTPSAQQWFSALPTEQAGLAGYAEWAGGKTIEDILGHMEQMRPKAPSGAGRLGWASLRQG